MRWKYSGFAAIGIGRTADASIRNEGPKPVFCHLLRILSTVPMAFRKQGCICISLNVGTCAVFFTTSMVPLKTFFSILGPAAEA